MEVLSDCLSGTDNELDPTDENPPSGAYKLPYEGEIVVTRRRLNDATYTDAEKRQGEYKNGENNSKSDHTD